MREITIEQHLVLMKRHCDNRGRHRFRTNKFGVTYCVICGIMNNKFAEKLKEDDKLIIKKIA